MTFLLCFSVLEKKYLIEMNCFKTLYKYDFKSFENSDINFIREIKLSVSNMFSLFLC